MTCIAFNVPGVPIGKGRARVSTIGGRARMYTPAKTVSYEALVSHEAGVAMAGQPLILGSVWAWLEISVPIPASWSKKKQRAALAGKVKPTGKPDIDNTCKVIFDGINQVVWKDDSQVVSLTAIKRYAEVPGVRVVIGEDKEMSDAK